MPKRAEIKGVLITMVGVMAAGYVMYQFRDIGFIAQSRAGYDT